ncbi:hypothetical protein ZWY2020_036897 [Hordeum vulgare]|nr:hypothetical protein ZWY2020_036897 [Hordeum vulgare]
MRSSTASRNASASAESAQASLPMVTNCEIYRSSVRMVRSSDLTGPSSSSSGCGRRSVELVEGEAVVVVGEDLEYALRPGRLLVIAAAGPGGRRVHVVHLENSDVLLRMHHVPAWASESCKGISNGCKIVVGNFDT